MFDNSGLVKLHKMGVVMYCWIKNATKRKKEACPKCQKRKVQKMLSLQPSAMERLNHELSAQRDRFIRLQSVQKDLALDLPTSIPLPDGEEIPYGSSTRLRIRDAQQESEIYQKCIRPPPNRTIVEGDPPPPYIPGSRQKKSDLFERTVRCFGVRRHEEPAPPPPPPPCVHVPTVIVPINRSRKLAAFSGNAGTNVANLPNVSCAVPQAYYAAHPPRQVIPEAYPGDKLRSHSAGIAVGGASGAATSAAAAAAAPATAASAGAAAAAIAPAAAAPATASAAAGAAIAPAAAARANAGAAAAAAIALAPAPANSGAAAAAAIALAPAPAAAAAAAAAPSGSAKDNEKKSEKGSV